MEAKEAWLIGVCTALAVGLLITVLIVSGPEWMLATAGWTFGVMEAILLFRAQSQKIGLREVVKDAEALVQSGIRIRERDEEA